jgi:hypothetical protein
MEKRIEDMKRKLDDLERRIERLFEPAKKDWFGRLWDRIAMLTKRRGT